MKNTKVIKRIGYSAGICQGLQLSYKFDTVDVG